MHKIIAGCALTLVLIASGRSGLADEAPVRLAPHRIVYELSLLSSGGARSIESARGRIAYEFTGDACEGYRLKYRQVTMLDNAETGTKMSDLRTTNFESGDGRSFSFRNDTRIEGSPDGLVEGSAEHEAGGALVVRLKKPKRQTFKLDPAAVFPNLQMRELISAARSGARFLPMKVFDGSDDGHTVYDTLAIIGRRIDPAAQREIEAPARQEALAGMARWPVSISYFKPGREDRSPVYTLGFEMFDNGVSRALRLDYGDFALKGDISRLDLLPQSGCKR